MENLSCVNLYEMTAKSNENLRASPERRTAENAAKIFLFSEADGRERTSAKFDESVNYAARKSRVCRAENGEANRQFNFYIWLKPLLVILAVTRVIANVF
jgi:hypothetical protein